MSALTDRWQQWSDRFIALSKRERGIVAGALILGGGFLLFNFVVEPFQLKARAATKAAVAANSELAQQQILLAALTAQNRDPDAPTRQRLAELRKQLADVGGRLAKFETGMVPPSRMQAFLEGLLGKNGGIELLGLTTLPVTQVGVPVPEKAVVATVAQAAQVARDPGSVFKDGAAKSAPATPEGIYQHGIEIRLAGNYNDLLNYLAELERMPQRVMWNSVSLTVEKYPRNILVLRVFTLSLDKNWLVV